MRIVFFGHTMKAVDKIRAKFKTCAAACRGFPIAESIFEKGSEGHVRGEVGVGELE